MADTWKKAPPELVQRFDELLDHAPQAERGQMFGYPCCSVRSTLFMGLHGDSFFLRLSPVDRDRLAKQGAVPFEPAPGKPMSDYMVLPAEMVADDGLMSAWIARAYAFALALPKEAGQEPSG